MASTKLKLGLTALVVAGVATTVITQHQSQVGVNQALRQQIAQLQTENEDLSNRVNRTTVPHAARMPMPAVAAVAPVQLEPSPNRNLYGVLTNRTSNVKLSPAQAEGYLKENQRNPASLLAAFRTTDDPALLQEAMQKYPNEPQVAFEAALRRDASPDERRQWLDAFKQSAPENALGDYLSAADHFKAGQADLAVQDLIAAGGKSQFQDYSRDRVQADEEAYRAAGYPVAEAGLLASKQLAEPQLIQVKELNGSLLDLAKSYQQAGDEASGQAVLQMAVNLGKRYSDASPGEDLLAQLVGINVESTALGAMDPTADYRGNGDGQTVRDRLNQLAQQRAALRQLSQQADPAWQTITDLDWISYHNRSSAFGEEAALRWLVAKNGPK